MRILNKYLLIFILFIGAVLSISASIEDKMEIKLLPDESYSRAFIRFLNNADKDPDAMRSIAEFYYYGKEVEKSLEKAIEWYMKAAERGDGIAQRAIGYAYFWGEGLPESKEEAAKWYQKGIESGDIKSIRGLGMCYLNDDFSGHSYEKAAKYFEEGINKGDFLSYHLLASLYEVGWGVPQSKTKSFQLLEQGANEGDEGSLYVLGLKYEAGEDVPQSYENAVDYYLKAAEMEYSPAQYKIGYFYEKGLGLPQSKEKALEWYLKSAQQGHYLAQNIIGVRYEYGDGLPQSYEKAAEWYEKAADQNNSLAQNNLGELYLYGNGVPQDMKKAFELFEISASARIPCDIAFFNMGRCYEYGYGVEQSYEKAADWYSRGAEKGEESCIYNLGVLYAHGNGVSQSHEKAVELYLQCAEMGDEKAQNNLGYAYINGLGVPQSYAEGFVWYLKAAENGSATAQSNLGVMYETGMGINKSVDKAIEWYMKAADNGSGDAIDNLRRLGIEYYGSDDIPSLPTLLANTSETTRILDESPMIEWLSTIKSTNKQNYNLRAALSSPSKIKDYKISINGITERGFSIVEEGDELVIDKNLILATGLNEIMITVINEIGLSSSKTFTVEYTPPLNIASINQKRLALIIGNGKYIKEDYQLRNPVNDATDIAEKLKKLGFDVMIYTDQDNKGMNETIVNFGNKSKDYDVALFYYAGHGIGYRGLNYMVPIDASLIDETDVPYDCVNMNRVLDAMEKGGNNMKLIVLDACRNNPFARSWHRGIGDENQGLEQLIAPTGTFIFYSTEPKRTAADGNINDRNSPFAQAFLETLEIPGLNLYEFSDEIIDKVAKMTNERQVPWHSGNPRGKFYFNNSIR